MWRLWIGECCRKLPGLCCPCGGEGSALHLALGQFLCSFRVSLP